MRKVRTSSESRDGFGARAQRSPSIRAFHKLPGRRAWAFALAVGVTILAFQQGCDGEPTSSTEGDDEPIVGDLQTFFVDQAHPAASDDNPGTEELPWATITKAEDIVRAGDVVYVKAGTYLEGGDCSWSRPTLNPENSGTAEHPIAFRAYPGHRVVVVGDGSGRGCAPIGVNGSDFIIWDGFDVLAIAVFNSTGTLIENCVVHGRRGPGGGNVDGIRIEDSFDIIVRNNVVYDIRNEENDPNATGIKLYYNERVLVENNEVYDVVAGLRNKTGGSDNVFRYNWVHDCDAYGIQLKEMRNGQAYGNIVSRCNAGVTVSGSGAHPTNNIKVFNNTIVDANSAISVRDDDVRGAEVWNNILYRSPNDRLRESIPGLTFCGFNLQWPNEQVCGSGNMVADPMFVDDVLDSPNGFKLRPGSPARGAGRNGEDIGAYAQGDEIIGVRR